MVHAGRSARRGRILCHVSPAPNSLLRDGWLVRLCLARALMMLPAMSYAGALPLLRTEWSMSATAAGSISTSSQLGYAVSLLALSWLADRVGARRVFVVSSVVSGVAAIAFALFARSYASAIVLHTLASMAQGGTYTTLIMLFADRYPPERRGTAVGWLIAALSLGYALSLAVTGLMLPFGGYPAAFIVTSAGCVVGAVIAIAALRDTPNVVHARSATRGFGGDVLTNRHAMLLMAGYTAHSWELLGMWAWVPAFIAATLVLSGSQALEATQLGAYAAAAFHLVGLVASSSMGRLSDRLGRRAVLIGCAAIAAACSFTFGWLVAAPAALVLIVGAIYAFTAIGDSPVLSTAMTEAVPATYLGSALAIRSLLGFGAGAIAPLTFGAILDATNPARATASEWGWAFVALGAGGLIATVCAWTLPRARASARAVRA
ncbi:MAG: MFS transporter [Candidatus Rokubacteria bacterium]|nr:MFS transporter [Candidatus Rokubacteria bacterium]